MAESSYGQKVLSSTVFKRPVLQTCCKFYRKRCNIHINCMTGLFDSCKVLPFTQTSTCCQGDRNVYEQHNLVKMGQDVTHIYHLIHFRL